MHSDSLEGLEDQTHRSVFTNASICFYEDYSPWIFTYGYPLSILHMDTIFTKIILIGFLHVDTHF